MVNKALQEILNSYQVDNDFREEVKKGLRLPLQKVISEAIKIAPNYRYGGSLAKGTANKNSCDVDLLCYIDAFVELSVENIYKKVVEVLEKSNPEIQINKVKESKSKDIIRLIKIYREKNNFSFKSFFLEIFAIDVVEPTYEEGDSLYDKLVKFCSHFNEIGIKKIYDPANCNNDIMKIHNDVEFSVIRNKIKALYEVLLTNDKNAIINCIEGKSYNIDDAYARDAKSHSKLLNLKENGTFISLKCKDDEGYEIFSNQPINKNKSINFYISVPSSIQIKSAFLIVSNSGYESINCKRGQEEQTCRKGNFYCRSENTLYNGNHYVQALIKSTTNNDYYSKPFIVKVRDFN